MSRSSNSNAPSETASRSRRTDRPMLSPRRPPAIEPTRLAASNGLGSPQTVTIEIPSASTRSLPADIPRVVLRIPDVTPTLAFTEQLIANNPPKGKTTRATVLAVLVILALLGAMLVSRGGKKAQTTPLAPQPAAPTWQSATVPSHTPIPTYREPAGPPTSSKPATPDITPITSTGPNIATPTVPQSLDRSAELRTATLPDGFPPRHPSGTPTEPPQPVQLLFEKLPPSANYDSP
jgi:hypothetical protein